MKYYPSTEAQAVLASKIARWGGKVIRGEPAGDDEFDDED